MNIHDFLYPEACNPRGLTFKDWNLIKTRTKIAITTTQNSFIFIDCAIKIRSRHSCTPFIVYVHIHHVQRKRFLSDFIYGYYYTYGINIS